MSQPAGTAPLLFYRATWYQIDISSAGWPLLSPSTYYWVAVTPSVPLQMTTQGGRLYNGAVWAALPDSLGRIPPAVVADPSLFLARQILSQRFAGDATFGANTVAAVNKNRNAEAWGEFNAAEYTNWAIVNASSGPNTTSSRARYGLQVLGFQVYPPVTVSSACAEGSLLRVRSRRAPLVSPAPLPCSDAFAAAIVVCLYHTKPVFNEVYVAVVSAHAVRVELAFDDPDALPNDHNYVARCDRPEPSPRQCLGRYCRLRLRRRPRSQPDSLWHAGGDRRPCQVEPPSQRLPAQHGVHFDACGRSYVCSRTHRAAHEYWRLLCDLVF